MTLAELVQDKVRRLLGDDDPPAAIAAFIIAVAKDPSTIVSDLKAEAVAQQQEKRQNLVAAVAQVDSVLSKLG